MRHAGVCERPREAEPARQQAAFLLSVTHDAISLSFQIKPSQNLKTAISMDFSSLKNLRRKSQAADVGGPRQIGESLRSTSERGGTRHGRRPNLDHIDSSQRILLRHPRRDLQGRAGRNANIVQSLRYTPELNCYGC